MTQLKTIGPTDLRESVLSLLDTGRAPWASIYVPVERNWGGTTSNPMRLRNLLDEVRDEASWANLSAAEVDELLAPATPLLERSDFWEGDLDGVALFLAPNKAVVGRLPFAPSSFAGLGDRIHVRPLWRYVVPDGTFYVLGLSAGGAALYRATRYHIEEVPLDDGPTTLDEVLQYDDHINTLRYHTKTSPGSGKGGRRSAIFFGHEDAGDKRYVKEGLLRFLRALDAQVVDVLDSTPTRTPLLLAGIEQLRGLYRQVSQYAHVLDAAIETSVIDPNTRTWDADALHERAWPIVHPLFERDREEALDQFRAAPARTAGNPGAVLLGAVEGRVDTLFVAETPAVWGTFNDDHHTVRVHDERQPGDLELLNTATVRTLQAGGTVYVTDATGVPDGLSVGALLRY